MTPDPGGYEFNAEENKTIGSLALSAQVAGGVLLLMAAWKGYQQIVVKSSIVGGALVVALYASLGIWTLGAGRAFGRIVSSQGNDIGNLDLAFVQLRKVFKLTRTLQIIVLVIFGLLFGLIAVGVGAFFKAVSDAPTTSHTSTTAPTKEKADLDPKSPSAESSEEKPDPEK